MDPNANLKEQAECLADLARVPVVVGDRLSADDRRFLRSRLSELRAALTDWLARGGFEPDWSAYPAAARYYGRPLPTLDRLAHYARNYG